MSKNAGPPENNLANALYTASTVHSSKSIERLCKTQYGVYTPFRSMLFTVLGVLLILFAALGNLGLQAGGVLAFCGVLLLVFRNAPALITANRMNRAIDGKYPLVRYYFFSRKADITDGNNWFSLPYDGLSRMAEDKEYFYLFLTRATSYSVDKATLKGGNEGAFRNFLQKESGMVVEKPASLGNLSLMSILQRLKNRRSRK